MKKLLIIIPVIFIVSCSNLQMQNQKKIAEQPHFNANSIMSFSIADMAYQNGDYKNAVQLFEKAEKDDPKSLEIKEMLILSLDALSKQDKTQIDKLLKLSDKFIKEGFKSDKIYLSRINALITNHNFEKAITELKESIKVKPTSEKYYKLFLLEGFVDKKPNLDNLKKAIKLSDNEKYDIFILENLTRMRNPIVLEAAKIIYKKWDDETTFDYYAENLIQYKFTDSFIKETLKRIGHKKKVSRKISISLFEILIQNKENKTIDKYSDYFTGFKDIRIDKAIFSIEDDLKNYDKAAKIMNNIFANYSIEKKDQQILYFFLTNTYLKQGNIDKAIETLSKIEDFAKIEYLIEKIRLTDDNNDFPKIKKAYLNSKNLDENFKLFFQYCLDDEKTSDSYEFLKQIDFSKISKNNAVYIVDIFLNNNDLENAKIIFQKIPSVKESFNLFTAYFYLAKQDFEKAEKFSKLEISQNENIDAYLFYSSILEKDKKIEKALDILEIANKKYPHNSKILNGLGYMMAENNIKLDVAEKYLLEATKLDSTSDNVWDSLMWLYYKQGKFKKALETFPPDSLDKIQSSTIAYHLGEIFFKLGRISDSKYYFKQAIILDTEKDAVISANNKLNEYFKEK